MGVRPRGSLAGKAVRLIGEPMCWLIGGFVGRQDPRSLYPATGNVRSRPLAV